jgi:hypothetical protein
MNVPAYLQSVAERGAMLRASNPTSLGGQGLGDTVSIAQFIGAGDDLSRLAQSFSITLDPVPTGLNAVDHQSVLASDLMGWQLKAQLVVIKAEQDAGLPIGGDSATNRIAATKNLENSIRGSLGSISAYMGSVLPDAIAPKVTQQDFARSLRRQYNSADAGTLAHTPNGVGLLLSAGATQEDLERDYLYRMTTYQAIVKLGEQGGTSTNGLGFLFLFAPIMIFAVVSVIAIIAAAIVCTIYITQRNQIWADVMKQCSTQATSSEFCKTAVEKFAEEPPWTLASILSTLQPLLWVGGGLLVFGMIRKRRKAAA